jgi:hypothetical protein
VNREQRLVHRLDEIARPDSAAVHDLLAERREDGPHALEHRGVAAAHDRQRPLLRPARPAAHRRVHERDAALPEPFSDPARRCRVAGRAIDKHSPALQPSEQPLRLAEQKLDVVRGR